jgi:hypothetical protein
LILVLECALKQLKSFVYLILVPTEATWGTRTLRHIPLLLNPNVIVRDHLVVVDFARRGDAHVGALVVRDLRGLLHADEASVRLALARYAAACHHS